MTRSLLITLAALAIATPARAADTPKALSFKMKTLDGKTVELSKYHGKVVLLVNVASQCGLTPQYEQLTALHDKFAAKGLAIVGVPCNQFGKQEPGSPSEIREFCSTKYGVKFDMLGKVDVNGDSACPLYKYLTSLDAKPKGPGKVSWNFEKFLLDREGNVVARFTPRTRPDAPGNRQENRNPARRIASDAGDTLPGGRSAVTVESFPASAPFWAARVPTAPSAAGAINPNWPTAEDFFQQPVSWIPDRFARSSLRRPASAFAPGPPNGPFPRGWRWPLCA